MKVIKLSLLEAGFLADTLEALEGGCSYIEEEKQLAIELLEKAIAYAEEEELPDGCKNVSLS